MVSMHEHPFGKTGGYGKQRDEHSETEGHYSDSPSPTHQFGLFFSDFVKRTGKGESLMQFITEKSGSLPMTKEMKLKTPQRLKPVLSLTVAFGVVGIFLIGCTLVSVPENTVSLENRNFSGTFSLTKTDYPDSNAIFSESGTIDITFTDSSYNYLAIVTASSEPVMFDTLEDSGQYVQDGNTISMADRSGFLMSMFPLPSLYLLGDFNREQQSSRISLTQDHLASHVEIDLQPAD